MITNFKIFENKKLYEYIDKILVDKGNNAIALLIRAYFTNELSIPDNKKHLYEKIVHIEFDCFEFNENNVIDREAYGNHEKLTQEELNKIDFMTPIEFYNNYPELCTNLYERVKHDFDNFNFTEGDGGWYPKLVKNYKRVLETIPEFEHYASAEKYNL